MMEFIYLTNMHKMAHIENIWKVLLAMQSNNWLRSTVCNVLNWPIARFEVSVACWCDSCMDIPVLLLANLIACSPDFVFFGWCMGKISNKTVRSNFLLCLPVSFTRTVLTSGYCIREGRVRSTVSEHTFPPRPGRTGNVHYTFFLGPKYL